MKVRSYDILCYVKDDSSKDIKVYGELHMDNNSDFRVYGLHITSVDSLLGLDEKYIQRYSDKSLYISYLRQFL